MDRLDTSPERVSQIIQIGLRVRINTYTVFQSRISGLSGLTLISRLHHFRQKIILWLQYMYSKFVLSWYSSAHRIIYNDQLANVPRSPPARYWQLS
jgi:hypothetical protein